MRALLWLKIRLGTELTCDCFDGTLTIPRESTGIEPCGSSRRSPAGSPTEEPSSSSRRTRTPVNPSLPKPAKTTAKRCPAQVSLKRGMSECEGCSLYLEPQIWFICAAVRHGTGG